jgi:hypothetical protein
MEFSFLGVQPASYAATAAQQQAFQTTTRLAASGAGSSSSILAAAAASAPSAAAPSAFADAQRSAAAACAANDALQCSELSQKLGMLKAQAACDAASHARQREAGLRARGSITDLWFREPSWVAPVNPTTADTAAVAVSLTAL